MNRTKSDGGEEIAIFDRRTEATTMLNLKLETIGRWVLREALRTMAPPYDRPYAPGVAG